MEQNKTTCQSLVFLHTSLPASTSRKKTEWDAMSDFCSLMGGEGLLEVADPLINDSRLETGVTTNVDIH